MSAFQLRAETQEAKPTCSEHLSDPYLWMEEVEGERALNWVKEQNNRTSAILEADPVYQRMFNQTKEILFAKDRLPVADFDKGYFWNFWQDENHQHGVLRRTTYEQYLKENPKWETILDLDQLARTENENWVYKGDLPIARHSSRRLMLLSRGGKDAVVIREFDLEQKKFVQDGFNVPSEAKTEIVPIDENNVLIATDFGKGSLTTSGYARIIKHWRRGEPLSTARQVFEVQESDLSAHAIKIEHGDERHVLFQRAIDFYNQAIYIEEASGELRQLPIPATANLVDVRDNKIYLTLREDLKTPTAEFKSSTIVSIGLNDRTMDHAKLVYEPARGESVQSVQVASGRIFVTLLTNVRNRVLELKGQADGSYGSRVLPFPANGTLSFVYKDEDDATSFSTMQYQDHLTPARVYRVHDEDGSYRMELLKSAPDRFDSHDMEVVQNFATSRDGTKVPYFLIKKKDLVLDGHNPTILYGYGGFEVSLTPTYSALRGKLWLERGGVYVIANIRGGGEFGPEWHLSAIREHRQRAFDDFAAVAEDLIAKKITSPPHLGINGGSNGGLLAATVMVQRPELMNAALIQVPLTDMLRFNKLLAGASWEAEYGNPDVPSDREFLLKYSPYQNVQADRHYPTPLFTTSTKDDRVHPAHSRKMAARMLEQGHPVLYYENVNGGHAGSANLDETAHMNAMEYVYLWRQLAAPKREAAR